MDIVSGGTLRKKLAEAGLLLAGMGLWASPIAQGQDTLPLQASPYYQSLSAPGQISGPIQQPIQQTACEADGGCTGAAAEEEAGPEAFSLTSIFDDCCGRNWMKDNRFKLGGNIAQSVTFNPQSPSDKFNGPVTWTDRSNEYQLNQFWTYLERTTDTSEQDFDIGGRVDVLYGTNARLTTESGLETPHLNSGNAFYGLAFPQFYVETAYKKLKVKSGHFISPVGYFTVDTTQNFFNTIPYTYQWGEPFTHTGNLATYQFSDNFVAGSGIIRGWDNFDNSNPHLGYIGTWAYTFQDKSNLAHAIFYSLEPNAVFKFTPRYYQSLVYSKPLCENWNYVAQSDFGVQQDATFTGKTARWYGLNQYLYYNINKQWTFGSNFEWFRDEQGFRVAGFLPGAAPSGITGNQRGLPTNRLGYNGNFFQITVGPKWQPHPNLFVRPNLRFDWYDGNIVKGLNPAGLRPFNDGNSNHQALFVTDLVVLF